MGRRLEVDVMRVMRGGAWCKERWCRVGLTFDGMALGLTEVRWTSNHCPF